MTLRVAMLGLTCSGKGVQGDRLEAAYEIPHITTGGLLRENSTAPLDEEGRLVRDEAGTRYQSAALPDTAYHETIQDVLDRGEGVIDETMLYFLEEALPETGGYVVDGFPRWGSQAAVMEEVAPIDAVLYLDISREEAWNRVQARGREDDTRDRFDRKMAWQPDSVQEVLDYYAADHPVDVLHIDGEQSIEAVWADVEDAVSPYVEGEV